MSRLRHASIQVLRSPPPLTPRTPRLEAVAMVAVLCLAGPALADEAVPRASEELAVNQKLERVYDLYRRDTVAMLKRGDVQVGVGAAYATQNGQSSELNLSARAFNAQLFVAVGVTESLEASITLPFVASSQRTNVGYVVLGKQSESGLGDPSLRLVKMVGSTGGNLSLILAATLPMGRKTLSSDETHTSLGLAWSKVLRPAFVSAGMAWERDWTSRRNGLSYQMGVGLFVNHAVSLGVEVAGVAVLNPKVGEVRDDSTLGLRLAYQVEPGFGLVVQATYATSSPQPQTTLGINGYWRY